MTQAERFARLNGIEWHVLSGSRKVECSCGEQVVFYEGNNEETIMREGHINPTFTDTKSILEVMMKREDWGAFSNQLFLKTGIEITGLTSIIVPLCYILNPNNLLDEAVKWCEANQPKCQHSFNEETGYCIHCFDNVHSVRK